MSTRLKKFPDFIWIVGTVILTSIAPASSNEFVNCDSETIREFETAKQFARLSLNSVESLLEKLISQDPGRWTRARTPVQLKRSRQMVGCILRKMETARVECVLGNKGYAGKATFYGNHIKLNRGEFSSVVTLGGLVAHEVAHLCGAVDTAYFDRRAPHSTLFGWPMIADTYSFWVANGFCVPRETCSAPPEFKR